jgi:hypothetical protein
MSSVPGFGEGEVSVMSITISPYQIQSGRENRINIDFHSVFVSADMIY